MHEDQLHSFIFKFKQLWKAGITAHLNLDTHAGQAWVGLRVQLGQVQQPPQHHQPYRQHRSPSYYRRQNRRQAARGAEVAPEVPKEAEKASTDMQKVEKAEKATNENVTEEIIKKNGAAEAPVENESLNKDNIDPPVEKTGFDCPICDFESGWENGLAIHMTRKHGNIEQLDGAADYVHDDDDIRYDRSSYYWKEGRIGIAYETYCDIVGIIDESDIADTEKKIEKDKVTEAWKKRFGQNFKNFPPWK